MKKILLSLTGCALIASTSACSNASSKSDHTDSTKTATADAQAQSQSSIIANDPGFVSDTTGLDYKWVTHGEGTQVAKVGDFGEMNVVFKIGDTTMINTMEMNNGQPVPQQFQAPNMKGDLMGGLLKMKAGDSVVFRMLMDTLATRAHQPKPAWAKPGDYAVWQIKMVSVKTKEQMEAAAKEKNKGQNIADDKLLQEYFKKNGIKNVKKTASGLYYTVAKAGVGAHPKEGQQVTVNYTGKNLAGEKFDSNVDPDFHHVEPFSFALGKHNVIAGWDEAVALMNKGMKATYYIPSSLAYGERGSGDRIPANTVLIFDIELVSFK